MSTVKSYRTCFVPLCGNNTKNSPNKVFASVPQDRKLRGKWFQAARRDNLQMSKSTFFCCEDHFNLQEDMENYMYYKIMKGQVKIKTTVVPHKFECQSDRKRRTCSTPRIAAVKRQRQMELKEIMTEANKSSLTHSSDILDIQGTLSELEQTTDLAQEPVTTDLCVKSPGDQDFTTCETTATVLYCSCIGPDNFYCTGACVN